LDLDSLGRGWVRGNLVSWKSRKAQRKITGSFGGELQGAITTFDYGCFTRAQMQQLYGMKVGPVFVELGHERIDPPWYIPLVGWTDHKGVLDHTLKDGGGLVAEARLTGYVELLKQMVRTGVVRCFLHYNGLRNPADLLTKAHGYAGWLVWYLPGGWLRIEPGEHAAKAEKRRAAKAAKKEYEEHQSQPARL